MPYKNKEKQKEYMKNFYLNNPNYRKQYRLNRKENFCKSYRKWHIKSKYNLSQKEWEGLWYSQDGRCSICDKFFEDIKDICVDHNHETGKIRGLLCKKCNSAIGFFNDNLQLLKTATEYLNNETN